MYRQLCIRGDNIWLEIAECVKKTLLAIGPKMQVPASCLEFLQLWHALANLPKFIDLVSFLPSSVRIIMIGTLAAHVMVVEV